jgi:hypothetical protein
MYRRVTLELPELLAEQLVDMADQERRDPQQQAVVIIERALKRRHRRTWPPALAGLTPAEPHRAREGP